MKEFICIVALILSISGCAPECNLPDSNTVETFNEYGRVQDLELDILIVVAGQSNAQGVVKEKYNYQELDNTYFFYDGNWYADHGYSNSGSEASLINKIAENNPYKKIGVIKYVQGASSIYAWRKDWVELDYIIQPNQSGWYLYQGMIAEINDAKLKSNKDSIDGIFWIQGETDGAIKDYADNHESLLTNFILDLREDVNDMPFIIGNILPSNDHIEYIHKIRESFYNISLDLENIYLVEMNDLELYCDGLHLTDTSQYELGIRFYEKYLEI